MSFVDKLLDRGYIYQCTNLENLRQITKEKKICAYIGFDCTANSLHIGNLLPIMFMRLLQQYGHKPIVLIGGATTRIGDPSFKNKMRPILSEEEIQNNIKGIKKSLSKFLTFGDSYNDAILLDNNEWLSKINYIQFLQQYGKHVSINRMLGMDSIKGRLDSNSSLTFLEFNYMLLQAYDFYYLNKNYNCILQIGGQDQWGNIVMGVDLTHKISKAEVLGTTIPLLLNSSGEKMGKTVDGAVWLNEENLSPYHYFQYWRNIEDKDILKYAKLFAEFSDKEFFDFVSLTEDNINAAKKQLAFKLTSLCHGKEANLALEISEKVFEQGKCSENLPTFFLKEQDIINGIHVCNLLHNVNLVNSKSEAKRLIRGGGVKINNIKIENENMIIAKGDLQDECIKITLAKKNHILLKILK